MHSPDQFVHFLHGIDGLAEMSGMGHSHRIPGQVLAHLPDTGVFSLVSVSYTHLTLPTKA